MAQLLFFRESTRMFDTAMELIMARPEVLDFNKLLAPIPGDIPAGADLRADPSSISDFYVIRDARKTASDTERRQDQGDETATPEWRPVRDRALKALAEKSK